MVNIFKTKLAKKNNEKKFWEFFLAYDGFEPGPPKGEYFIRCKMILKPYFQLHSGLILLKKVHWGSARLTQAQI